MAQSQEWKINSTEIKNGRIKVSGKAKYVKDGVNKFSTFTSDNLSGRVPLDDGSADRIVKSTYYSIDSDGYIDFYRKDAQGKFKKYQSIQEIADAGIAGYNQTTTDLLKANLSGRLDEQADKVQIPGPADPNANVNNDGNIDDGNNDNNDTDQGGAAIDAVIVGVDNTPTGQYAYPLDINTPTAVNLDRIRFIQGTVKGKEIPSTPSLTSDFRRNEFTKYGNSSVTIGIQPQISDSNSVKWNGSNLNNLQAFAATASMAIAGSKDLTGAIKTTEDIAGQFVSDATGDESIAKGLRTYFAAKAAGIDGGALLSRTSGAVLNPNLELLFEGPDLRQFNYTFKMSAESQAEAQSIKNIIRWFKKGMSIRRQANSGLFLTTPNVFRIRYIQGESDIDHPGINLVKDCALLNCAVNYTPEGNYSTFTDGTMTMYEMTLSFGELSPIFSEDYDKLPANSIGL